MTDESETAEPTTGDAGRPILPVALVPSDAPPEADPLDSYPPELVASGFAQRFEAVCAAIEGSTGQRPATIRAALRVPAATSAAGAPFAWSSFRSAMHRHPSLQARYARAREAAADAFADEATRYARLAHQRHGSDDKQGVQAARLAFDAARWRASVANPKRYGSVPDGADGLTVHRGVVALPPEQKPQDVQDLEEGTDYTVTESNVSD